MSKFVLSVKYITAKGRNRLTYFLMSFSGMIAEANYSLLKVNVSAGTEYSQLHVAVIRLQNLPRLSI